MMSVDAALCPRIDPLALAQKSKLGLSFVSA